jgi:hypothetical protein
MHSAANQAAILWRTQVQAIVSKVNKTIAQHWFAQYLSQLDGQFDHALHIKHKGKCFPALAGANLAQV